MAAGLSGTGWRRCGSGCICSGLVGRRHVSPVTQIIALVRGSRASGDPRPVTVLTHPASGPKGVGSEVTLILCGPLTPSAFPYSRLCHVPLFQNFPRSLSLQGPPSATPIVFPTRIPLGPLASPATRQPCALGHLVTYPRLGSTPAPGMDGVQLGPAPSS